AAVAVCSDPRGMRGARRRNASPRRHPERRATTLGVPMSTETQIALYMLLVTVFALLVTAGNYLVQKYLNKTMKGLKGELDEYKNRGAPTPDFVTKLYDDIKDVGAKKAAAEKEAAGLRHDVENRDQQIQTLTTQNAGKAGELDSLKGEFADLK